MVRGWSVCLAFIAGPGATPPLRPPPGMAASLARGLTQEELSRLAAFFTVLGDLLALYVLDAPEGRQNAPPTGP